MTVLGRELTAGDLRNWNAASLYKKADRCFRSAEIEDAMFLLELARDRGKASAEVHLHLALTYLLAGRFDSADAVLETAQKEHPDSQHAALFKSFRQHAKDMKRTLTQARDALRRQGIDVTYPDERIFLKVLSLASPKNHYLKINLIDAWVAAFPESERALRHQAEINLGFVEYVPEGTNVPHARGLAARELGRNALDRIVALDRRNPYPPTRMTLHVLVTLFPEGKRSALRWTTLPKLLVAAWKDLDNNSLLTDQQKAYLYYGRAMYYLYGPSWGRPMADDLIKWLELATRLDPETKAYSAALADIRVGKDAVNRAKQQARALEKSRSREFARQMLGLPNRKSESDRWNRDAELAGAVYRTFWVVMVELNRQEARDSEEHEIVVELLEAMGCPLCWGVGRDLWSGQICHCCGGDGKAHRQ